MDPFSDVLVLSLRMALASVFPEDEEAQFTISRRWSGIIAQIPYRTAGKLNTDYGYSGVFHF